VWNPVEEEVPAFGHVPEQLLQQLAESLRIVLGAVD